MVYFENDYASVDFLEDEKIVVLKWKKDEDRSGNYRFTLTKALAVTKKFSVKSWLSDVNNISAVGSEVFDWVVKTLAPSMREDFLNKIAFVGKGDVVKLFENDELKEVARKRKIRIKTFNRKEPALKWLTK